MAESVNLAVPAFANRRNHLKFNSPPNFRAIRYSALRWQQKKMAAVLLTVICVGFSVTRCTCLEGKPGYLVARLCQAGLWSVCLLAPGHCHWQCGPEDDSSGSLYLSLADHRGSGLFVSEPFNSTINEGETIHFNCTLAAEQSNQLIAVWIIDGLQYYLGDFKRTSTYSYNLADNSLTIHNISRTLDGSSFQCIINRQASKTGYLIVQYTYVAASETTTDSDSSKPVHAWKYDCSTY